MNNDSIITVTDNLNKVELTKNDDTTKDDANDEDVENFCLQIGSSIKSQSLSQKTNSESFIVGLNDADKAPSLQESFAKFRKAKVRERQLLKACRENNRGERTQEFKDQLRQKFLNGCRKYFGVPYHEKYRGDKPLAPLYLDCCGLIRQVVRDLADDFGFVIGKWNQAYQIDVLPKAITFEELKPGDLIFYEGDYSSERSKKQKHDMVHVEVFIGGKTGEGTIGARFAKGVVQEFPSYLFPSTLWNLKKVHFRSIDPWLEGKCESCCDEHRWHSDALAIAAAAGKRSIFNDIEDDDEDVSAGGMDDDDDMVQEGGSGGEQEVIIPVDDVNKNENETKETGIVVIESQIETPLEDDVTDKEIIKGTEKLASTTITTPSSPNKKMTTITTSTPSTPKSMKNISSFNPKQSLGSPTSKTPTRGTLRVSKSMELQKSLPRTYYVMKANGWRLVKAAMDKRGWQQLPFEYNFSNRFGMKWVERRGQIDYKAHTAGQLVCHIPNNDVICTKVGLLTALRDKFCDGTLTSGVSGERKPTPWLPETYNLDFPMDAAAAVAEEEARETPGMWIYKPASANRGNGIRVLKGLKDLKKLCFNQDDDEEVEKPPPSPNRTPTKASVPKVFRDTKGIVQRYIENPLLVDGRKFDIRCYLLISRNYPNYLGYYHPGYCRMTISKYTDDDASISDNKIHLTNNAVQKNDPEYQNYKEQAIQTPLAVSHIIEAAGFKSQAEYMRNELDNDIKRCMVDVLKAGASGGMSRKHGYFDLLGFDFMVTTDNELKLLEVNTNPSLALSNSTLEQLLPEVVDGAVDLVLGTQGPDVDTSISSSEVTIPPGYELIYDESKSK